MPELLDKWARLRMGHEAVMLKDAQEVLAQQRQTVAAHQRANGLQGSDDDVGNIIIGDQTINHAPAQQQPAAKGMSPLAKALIGGAIATGLGGGIGGALALPSIIEALNPAATPPTVDTDTDTIFDLFIGAPKQ